MRLGSLVTALMLAGACGPDEEPMRDRSGVFRGRTVHMNGSELQPMTANVLQGSPWLDVTFWPGCPLVFWPVSDGRIETFELRGATSCGRTSVNFGVLEFLSEDTLRIRLNVTEGESRFSVTFNGTR